MDLDEIVREIEAPEPVREPAQTPEREREAVPEREREPEKVPA